MRSRRRSVQSLLAAVAGALLLAAPPAAAREVPVELRLSRGALVVPREHPALRARVVAPASTGLRVLLLDADGTPLASSATLHLRPRAPRALQMRPTVTGARRLGRCVAAPLTLVVRSRGLVRRRHVTTVPDPVRCGPLRWPPPKLEDPQRIDLQDGFTDLRLEPGRDYVLRLPPGRKLGGAFIEGGRNVVVIGGHISLPRDTTSDQQRRALYFKGQTGIVHVEGVLIDGSGGGEGDGIALSAPQAIVQIENVRIVDLHGSQGGTHADVIQPWGGVRELRIDRLTGSSRFQGLQLPVALGPIGGAEIRYADLRALPSAAAGQGGGHLLWLTEPGSCDGYSVALEHVYVAARPGRSIGTSVWPGAGDGSRCAAVEQGGAMRWPALPVRGEVRAGAPAGGDYVPRWNVGEDYRSPGYGVAMTARTGSAVALAAVLRALIILGW